MEGSIETSALEALLLGRWFSLDPSDRDIDGLG